MDYEVILKKHNALKGQNPIAMGNAHRTIKVNRALPYSMRLLGVAHWIMRFYKKNNALQGQNPIAMGNAHRIIAG